MSRNFNSPRLIRLLGDSTLVDPEPPRQDFAERLGLWLSAMDTVTLHAALQSIHAPANEVAPAALRAPALSVGEDVRRVREALVSGIMAAAAAAAAASSAEAASDARADYAPHHKRYAEQQRQMESKIGPLRARVRQALLRASPPLRQLATLDAVMDQTLGVREQKLLSTVPVFLERRFEQARQAQQLHRFGQEWQAALLAELEVRLQPVMGLMEAFNEVKKQP